MTESEIDCFLAICRHKTGSRAAEALYITQPSLSSRLKNLEREVGGTLFQRRKGSREMTLTAAGKEFYKLAVQYEMLIRKMGQVCKNTEKSLRISSLNSLDTFLLPLVYERFTQTHPEIGVEIRDMDILQASQSLCRGEIDLAFTSGRSVEKGLERIPAFIEPMVLICPQEEQESRPVRTEELLLRQEVYIEWSRGFAEWHRQELGEPQPQITVSIMSHLQQFMDRENCWAIVPVSVAEGLCRNGSVKIRKTAFQLPKREVSIVRVADEKSNPTILLFCECLKEILAGYSGIKILL